MSRGDLPRTLPELGVFRAPAPPATRTVEARLRRLWIQLRGAQDEDSSLVPDELQRVRNSHMAERARRALKLHHQELLGGLWGDGGVGRAALLCQPGTPEDILSDWAEAAGHEVMSAAALMALPEATLCDGATRVVPSLSGLYERRVGGLTELRAFLEQIDRDGVNVIVGLSGWAWRFLDQAASIGLVFDDVRSLPPFDRMALAAFLDAHGPRVRLRASKDGKDILARDDDGALSHGYLTQLAAETRGHPWAAVALLAARMRHTKSDEDDTTDAEDEEDGRTLWIKPPEHVDLPTGYQRLSRLILHAVLVHDGLPEAAMVRVLPEAVPTGLIGRLCDKGLLRRTEGRLSIPAVGYADVRRLLSDGGLPRDPL